MIRVSVRAGHTMKTPGKEAPNGIKERYLNDLVKVHVIKDLKSNGFQVLDVSSPLNGPESRLNDAKKSNTWGAYIHLELHHNAMDDVWQTKCKGIETFYISEKGKILAKFVNDSVVKETKSYNRGIKSANTEHWTMLDKTLAIAILVELDFEDNPEMFKKMTQDDKFNRACARGIVSGTCEYFGMNYVPYEGDDNEMDHVTSDIIEKIKEFQKQEDLIVDGIIGPKTWTALMNYKKDYIDLNKGIDELQKKLENERGIKQ